METKQGGWNGGTTNDKKKKKKKEKRTGVEVGDASLKMEVEWMIVEVKGGRTTR